MESGFVTNVMYGSVYESLATNALMLSGDIETNPGPVNDTDMILKAISDSNKQLNDQISGLRHDITEVKGDLRGMKTELNQVSSKMKVIERDQKVLNDNMFGVHKRVETLEYQHEMASSDINGMSMHLECELEKMEIIEQQLLYAEAEKCKCGMRIFGLAETESDTNSLTDVIENEIFGEMDDEEKLNNSNIVSAKRVGQTEAGKPRMVIVEFDNLENKLKIFKCREKLRVKSVRVASDLGYMHRQIIRRESEKGFRAYFKSGKLHRVPKPAPESNPRSNRRGVRTLDDRNRQNLRAAAVAEVNVDTNVSQNDDVE